MAKTKKPKKPKNIKSFLIPKLRGASLYWEPRAQALRNARVSHGKYQCKICEQIYNRKDVHLDHDPPVIDPRDGFIDWNTFIDRLFCGVEGFRTLCVYCHDTVTNFQKELRAEAKADLKARQAEEKEVE